MNISLQGDAAQQHPPDSSHVWDDKVVVILGPDGFSNVQVATKKFVEKDFDTILVWETSLTILESTELCNCLEGVWPGDRSLAMIWSESVVRIMILAKPDAIAGARTCAAELSLMEPREIYVTGAREEAIRVIRFISTKIPVSICYWA